MKIAVNGWRLRGDLTGVGRYLLSILRRWNAELVPPAVELELHSIDDPPDDLPAPIKPVVDRSQSRMLVWENTRFGPRTRADVLFCPSYSRPILARAPVVVTTHDVASAIHPEMFPAGQRW